jgi:hypothetical protein
MARRVGAGDAADQCPGGTGLHHHNAFVSADGMRVVGDAGDRSATDV